ncbi:hypothetical protein HOY34_08785 [Xinfangfangia sp. D13-10-4-6]|uniref:hypothetical protein n=1 Tax=Pseudogemmobacter hezensis TaxID=2737662 RepID=UPI00155501E9|nr:hypothetical protein [Pseudogemmobacter hezensis]NPD15293.1 hypothetical protein [Pseudogemmobacter hezensis]
MITDTDTLVARFVTQPPCQAHSLEAADRIRALELLLARNLVMDRGSAEEGANARGGIGRVIELVEEHREVNPLPVLAWRRFRPAAAQEKGGG